MAEAQQTTQAVETPAATRQTQAPPAANPPAPTPSSANTQQGDKGQEWKFDSFKTYGFKETASALFGELLQETPEQERARITASEGAFGAWTSDSLEKVAADVIKFRAAEKAANEKKIAEQQKFVEEFSAIAPELFGEDHEQYVNRMKEKAGKVDPDLDIYRKFASLIPRNGVAAKRDVGQTTERAAHAASAPETGQSKKSNFHLPTPEPPSATAEDKRLLTILCNSMYN